MSDENDSAGACTSSPLIGRCRDPTVAEGSLGAGIYLPNLYV